MRSLCIPAALLFACGGPGTFTGTVQGNGFTVNDSVFLAGREIWLTDVANLCTRLQDNKYPKGGTIVKITATPLDLGTFTINTSQGHAAGIQFFKLDDTCTMTLDFGHSIATTGTVHIDTFEKMKTAEGRFDVSFTNDPVKGDFRSTFCDAPTVYDHPECT